jgi:CubicO group peptidase (beta-lactamase class C family)
MAQVQGTCPAKFEGLKKLLEEQIATGEELGASIVINIDGKEVVDIWGGYKDLDRKELWAKDTIVNVWSSTKTLASLAVLMLISQGKLSAYDKVSKYWPEFAANGKENVEVRHFLSHTSGVSAWEKPITIDQVCDVKYSTEKLASQAPWWEPGSASGYHSLNMGHLLGELVRRVSGKSLTQFVAEEIAGPLDADFQIGAKEADWGRITNVIPPPPRPIDITTLPQDGVMYKTYTGPGVDATFSATPIWRKAEIGAANGHGNARALNRTASVVSLGGTVKGKRFLSRETIDLIFQEQSNGTDLVIGLPLRFGIGYGLRSEEGPTAWLPKGKVCFWGGWGGSSVIMDVGRKLTFTYVMNKMGGGTLGSARTHAYVNKVYEVLGDSSVGVPWSAAV